MITVTDNTIASINASLLSLNREITQCVQNEISALTGQISDVSTCSSSAFDIAHPVGEVYIQFPTQMSPKDLWGNYSTWEDITETYAGLFFRAAGGDATSFKNSAVSVQEEGLPNISGTIRSRKLRGGYKNTWGTSGAFSSGDGDSVNDSIDNVASNYSSDIVCFDASCSNEVYGSSDHVTPINTSIRIWKRTK